MSRTREEIQFKVLSILVGGDVGQSPAAADAEAIDAYIDDEVSEINTDQVTYISDPNELDEAIFLTFCKLVANAAAEEFGAASDEAKAQQWRNRIRVLNRQTPGYGPQETSYF